jgi:uncharacterized ParB-like nuclease family protein
MKTHIYVLINDSTGKPFYCGKTKDPKRRLREHLDEAAAGGRSMKCGHIRALTAAGITVSITVVDSVETDDGDIGDLEAWWVDQLEWSGQFLYNGNSGVRGAAIDEVALRDIQAARKRWKTPNKKPVAPVPPLTNERRRLLNQQAEHRWREYERIKAWADANPEQFERQYKEKVRRERAIEKIKRKAENQVA